MHVTTKVICRVGLGAVLVGAIACATAYAAPAYDNSIKQHRTFVPAMRPWWLNSVVELISNGGFETGTFAPSWNVVNDAGGGGNWFVTNQLVTPLSGFANPPAAEGSFQAIVDQTGPGLHILYQDVVVPVATSVTLNLILWAENYNGSYVDAGSLDPLAGPNQQARVDIMSPGAPIDDVGAGVLLNVFKTNPGDPTSIPQTALSADLTALQGQVVRLRIAEVDNQFFFNVGVNAVSISADVVTAERRAAWGGVKARYR